MLAHASSIFDRWRLGWAGAERITPHLLVSFANTDPVGVDFGWALAGSRERDAWEREIQAMFLDLKRR